MAPAADAKVFSAQATVADAPHPTQFTAALHSRSTSGSNAEAHVHEAVGFDTPATPLLHCAVDELLGSAFSLPARHCQPKIHPYSREQHKDPGSDGFRDSARGVSSVSWPFYQCLPARTALKSPRVTKDMSLLGKSLEYPPDTSVKERYVVNELTSLEPGVALGLGLKAAETEGKLSTSFSARHAQECLCQSSFPGPSRHPADGFSSAACPGRREADTEQRSLRRHRTT